MFSFRKAFRDIANWVKGVDDYIIKTGTSGIWTYEKYKSGKVKAWGLSNSVNTGTLTKSSYIYYKANLQIATLPTGLFDAVTNIQATYANPTTVGWLSGVTCNNNKISVTYDREQQSSTNLQVFLKVIGTSSGGVTNLLRVLRGRRWSYA